MKISWDGPLPQVELGPHLGGAKTLFMRSGIVTRMITMLSAMSAAWATSHTLRQLFGGSYPLFVGAAGLAMAGWMVLDYVLILPSEQAFRQGQAHREERSPLKRDHDEIIERLDELPVRTDGSGGDGRVERSCRRPTTQTEDDHD